MGSSRTQFTLDMRLRSWDLGQILDFCRTLVIMTPAGHLDEGQKSSPAEGSPKPQVAGRVLQDPRGGRGAQNALREGRSR